MNELGIAQGKRLGGLGIQQRGRLRRFLVDRETANRGRSKESLVVLAGPTAVGKGTVAAYIRERFPEIVLSVSATTRPPREGEREGISYYFVDDERFDDMIARGELLEWAVVHNSYRYGTPRTPVYDALSAGKQILLEIDLQGARAVRRSMPDARLIFLYPPTWDELVRRLQGRGTETREEQERRLDTAREELDAVDEFDYVVINDEVAKAAGEVVSLMNRRSRRG